MNRGRLPRIHRIEDEFHDLKARRVQASATLYAWGALRYAENYAYNLLGDVKDKVIIDIGCGTGRRAVQFARRGAIVHAFDLSAGMVKRTRALAEENGLADRIIVQRTAAEALSYPSDWADLMFGGAILHHLDIPPAISEIHRILRPGGRAVFLEPLGHNPMINLFRRLTPSRRTATEVPLTFTDMTFITGLFSQSSHREFYLLALGALLLLPLRRKGLFSVILDRLVAFDQALMRRIPAVARFCWVTVMEVVK